jgi:Amt family ammonium transporter
MQLGFAFLEAGSVRFRNLSGTLALNFADWVTSSIAFYLVGYAFAFGAVIISPIIFRTKEDSSDLASSP